MKSFRTAIATGLVLLGFAGAGPASAAIVSCGGKDGAFDFVGPKGAKTSDVATAAGNSSSCLGLYDTPPNVSTARVNADAFFGFKDWQFGGKLNSGGAYEDGVLDNVSLLSGGRWSIDGLGAFDDFMVVLKQSEYFAAYFFSSTALSTGTWSTRGWDIGRPAGGLSFLSVYVRGKAAVPEPSTIALFGLVLGAGLLFRKRARA